MRSEKYNLYKIKFILETLKSDSDKLEYLMEVKNELNTVINSFESPKVTSIRNYGSDKHFLEDNCPELKSFVHEMIRSYSHFQNDQRNPSDETLKALVKNEAQEYKKILLIIESEIAYYSKNSSENNGQKSMERKDFDVLIESLDNEVVFSHETSAGVMVENNISNSSGPHEKIVWHGNEKELINFVDNLINDNIFRFDSNDKKLSFLSEYFVNSLGVPFTFGDQFTEDIEVVSFNWPKGNENLVEFSV